MSFAILGLGTAVPATSADQATALQIARRMCCQTPEQESWLPAVYAGSGIERRHLAFDSAVVNDLLHGTNLTRSVFLPKGTEDDRGPTTYPETGVA